MQRNKLRKEIQIHLPEKSVTPLKQINLCSQNYEIDIFDTLLGEVLDAAVDAETEKLLLQRSTENAHELRNVIAKVRNKLDLIESSIHAGNMD